ncbi:MAG TPA: sulfotransferase [Nocardioides sp.]|nr:sulfotransferase [Nocardioides sp.]
MAASTSQVTVLSVVGAGRSGTTVLASILGEVPGCAGAGEIRWLWERGVLDGRPCGCGEKPATCPVWSQVIERCLSTPGPDGALPTVEAIVAAQNRLDRTRSRWRVLRGEASDEDVAALRLTRHVTGEVVRGFAEATGAGVVIDTSKRPLDAAVMADVPGIDHYVLHMLRDPRAVAYSWRRAKPFSVGAETRTMGTRKLPAAVRRWLANALGTEVLHRRVPSDHWQRLRYEDFCAQPAASMDGLLTMLGVPGRPPFEDAGTVQLQPNHIVAGNPSRFTVGSVRIRVDEEWKSAMSRRDQLVVVASTWPLLRRYGYPWRA